MLVVLIDKEPGPTSHDVVARLRRVLGQRRVGHTGTLDPFASGLLPCCVGRATRIAPFISDQPKTYEGVIELGYATDTLDPTGRISERRPVEPGWEARLEAVRRRFVGTLEQVPPMYSAVRVGGRRLYKAARQGMVLERPPRTVTVERLDLEPIGAARLWIDARVSSGTYVRVLALDLAKALGTVGTLTQLRRTSVGSLGVEEALSSRSLAPGARERLRGASCSPSVALAAYPALTLRGTAVARLRHGVAPGAGEWSIEPGTHLRPNQAVRLVDRDGALLALARISMSDGGRSSCELLRVLVGAA